MDRVRVVIVDDRERTRQSVGALLTSTQAGAPDMTGPVIELVGEAANGEAALALVGRVRPDVVLMDLNMPKMDGLTATRLIKSWWPDIRVVVLTLYAAEKDQAFEVGADAFLVKGCSTAELLHTITALGNLSPRSDLHDPLGNRTGDRP